MTDRKTIEWLESMKRGVCPFPGDIKTRDELLDTAISALKERNQRKERVNELINALSCLCCDRFGIDCGSCEGADDD